MNKTKKVLRVMFHKAGMGDNGKGARVNLSVPFLRNIGVTEENRMVLVEYSDDKITISKYKGEE